MNPIDAARDLLTVQAQRAAEHVLHMAARTRSQGSSLRGGTGRVCLEHNSNLSSRDDQAGLRVLAVFVGPEALELIASPTAADLTTALPHRRE